MLTKLFILTNFSFKGPTIKSKEDDGGLSLLNELPDDHVAFSQVDTTVSEHQIIEELTQLENSQLKRMTEEERNSFLQEKKEEHEREVGCPLTLLCYPHSKNSL